VVTILATFADEDIKARDRAAFFVLVCVHRAVFAQAAHELVVSWRYRGKAVVLVIGDRRGESLEVVRAPYKFTLVRRTSREAGNDAFGEESDARKRRWCWRRQRARIDSDEFVISVHPAGN